MFFPSIHIYFKSCVGYNSAAYLLPIDGHTLSDVQKWEMIDRAFWVMSLCAVKSIPLAELKLQCGLRLAWHCTLIVTTSARIRNKPHTTTKNITTEQIPASYLLRNVSYSGARHTEFSRSLFRFRVCSYWILLYVWFPLSNTEMCCNLWSISFLCFLKRKQSFNYISSSDSGYMAWSIT